MSLSEYEIPTKKVQMTMERQSRLKSTFILFL